MRRNLGTVLLYIENHSMQGSECMVNVLLTLHEYITVKNKMHKATLLEKFFHVSDWN